MRELRKEDHILFINQSSGYLMIDIINGFKGHIAKRTLLTGFLNPRNNPLDSDVQVHKLVRYNRRIGILRLFTWTWAFVQCWWIIMTRYRRSHLFIVSNPPFATLLPLFLPNAYSYLIFDVYPDALVEMKVMGSGHPFVKWWRSKHEYLFDKADNIFTISAGMQSLLTQYTSFDKIELVPLWTDSDFLQAMPKNQNFFAKKHHLEDKFVLLYSGNLGKTHEISVLIKVAEKLKSSRAFILIIGEGTQYHELAKGIKNSGLSNIRLMPWQPTENIPFTFATADVGIVTLGKEATNLSIPSKTYNYLSVEAPIIGISSHQSTLAREINKYEAGANFEPEQLEDMVTTIRSWMENREVYHRVKKNASHWASFHTPKNAHRFAEELTQ